ncbi:AfsR/SARP family transcriptional regulator [Rhizomonospora bruguierae]|uniref:AfsR/SARP family transcriptional regulator n=1 Tax=Rhizomonospora bruguierae TaxID=1581705 RepID=UPI001BCB5A04|nr:BTAD domain-containing putative transcriptional regulator [Micromonospora sp. NBRC 107566]
MSQAGFRLLGPVQATGVTGPVGLGGPRAQAILAALLLDANRVVSVEQLVDASWGEHPPASARVQAQNRVSGLRRVLRAAQPDRDLIETAGSGYAIRIEPDQLDVHRFESGVARSDALLAQGCVADASRELAEALAVWRGPALDGLDTPALRAAAQRLEEGRLRALEKRIQLDLDLGRHEELIGELSGLVADHPLRERVRALLMLALYRSGRRADALRAFRDYRQWLAQEQGLDPGGELRALEASILRADPALSPAGPEEPAPAPVVRRPSQLPAGVADFIGRSDDLAALNALVAAGLGGRGAGTVIMTISGTAGVGKTALAVHWAHRVADHFPDGQLFVNLHGYSADRAGVQMRPMEALAQFLRALGVDPKRIPDDLDEAAAMYRSLLADKRMLVVLDNARSAEQVRPLLPGGPGCLVVVTSRDRLAGLAAREGARRISLDVLTRHDATTLLHGIIGADRAAAEPRATAELADLCGHLPLALRVVAANVADDPGRAIGDHVRDLREGNRLARLAIDGDEQSAVYSAFAQSYLALPEPARRLFRLLGAVPGRDFTADAAAALAAVPDGDAARLLDKLAAAHLVHQHVPGRYTFHDLLRLYARDRLVTEEEPAERRAAATRLYDWYLALVNGAARRLYPHILRLPGTSSGPALDFDGPEQALERLDAERSTVVGAILETAINGPYPVSWLLNDALRGYFRRRWHTVEWMIAAPAALAAAEAAGDLHAQTCAQLSLGAAQHCLGKTAAAAGNYSHALRLSRRVGWPEGEATALGNLGIVHTDTGALKEATRHLTQALTIHDRLGKRGNQALTLNDLGFLLMSQGRLGEAREHAARALALHRQNGNQYGEASALYIYGQAQRLIGELDEAADHMRRALAAYRRVGSEDGAAYALSGLAAVLLDRGRPAESLERARAALSGNPTRSEFIGTFALSAIGAAQLALGDHAAARESYDRVLSMAIAVSSLDPELRARIGLAGALGTLGEPATAREHGERALSLAQGHGFRVAEGEALVVLAELDLAAGQPCPAATRAARARDLHRSLGCRLAEARALITLGRATGGTAGRSHVAAASAIYRACGATPPPLLGPAPGEEAGRGLIGVE